MAVESEGRSFRYDLRKGRVTIEEGAPRDPDAVVRGPLSVLKAFFHEGAKAAELVARGPSR